jgi:hypothetical protein
MKTRVARIAAFAVLAASIAPVRASASSAGSANPAWDKLKSLVGTWQGTAEGRPVSVTYTLVSNGTSLMESLTGDHDTNMITMYAPDGGSILATHYCAAGNQPRMRAKAPAGDVKSLDFQFVDATNTAAAPELMKRLVVTFQDPNHFTQSWTSSTEGKEQTTDFVYTRKKP